MISGKRILVSGGAGFIGSHLVDKLHSRNDILIYDNFRRNSLKFSDSNGYNGVSLIDADILDTDTLDKAMKGVDTVFHLAGVTGVETILTNPLTTMEVNLLGTYNMLKIASKHGVKRFVYASTSEVYGPHVFLGKEQDRTTQGPVSDPRWSYAVSKLAGEHFAMNFHKNLGLGSTVLRLFNIYGPRQTGGSAMRNFIVNALKNEPLIIFGDGLQIRAWCYVEDAINAFLLSEESNDCVGQVINVGNPHTACTISGLARLVIECTGSKSIIKMVNKPYSDIELRVPDISLAQKLLHFVPKYDLREGIRLTAEFFNKQ